jgi:hypothetical protein
MAVHAICTSAGRNKARGAGQTRLPVRRIFTGSFSRDASVPLAPPAGRHPYRVDGGDGARPDRGRGHHHGVPVNFQQQSRTEPDGQPAGGGSLCGNPAQAGPADGQWSVLYQFGRRSEGCRRFAGVSRWPALAQGVCQGRDSGDGRCHHRLGRYQRNQHLSSRPDSTVFLSVLSVDAGV